MRIMNWVGVALIGAAMLAGVSCSKEGGNNSSGTSGGGDSSGAAGSTAKIFKASDPNSLKLAFITNNVSDFWKIAAAGVHKYEKEAGVQVNILMPPSAKTEEQNGYFENLTSQGYNGIAVSVIAPNDQINVVNRAAKKTNVITFDSDSPKSNRILYIGTNNFEAGKTLGAEIVKLLPKGGKMAIFVGTLAADNAAQRLGGIEEAIKGHNIEIVAKKEDATDKAKARSNVEDVINAYSDLNLVCGLWSYNGPAIASALEGSGKKGKIFAAVFDEEAGTLDGIKSGSIQCTCVQKPFQFGYLSSKWLHELATKGDDVKLPPNNNVDTGVTVINKENVEQFQKDLETMKSGS